MLTIEGLYGRYGDVTVLHDISLTVERGSVVSVVGVNGAGKTSLMKSIMGVEIKTHGKIRLEGEDISDWPTHRRVEAGITMVPEGRRLFPYMSVKENLEMGSYPSRSRKYRREGFDFVYSLLPKLKEREKQPAGSLSGGEQQMVALGRALMSRPRLLLLDEPFLGLAPIVVRQIRSLIPKLKNQGITLLMVEQNVASSLGESDWGYVMVNGSLVFEGKADDLLRSRDLHGVYLGV
jgi:branched-chain amino acid transport system ATP-binding protein